MLYQFHETTRSLLSPFVYWSQANARMFSESGSWMSRLPGAERVAASYELMHRLGKDYEKPEFELHEATAHGNKIAVIEQTVVDDPFCRLLRFKRYSDDPATIDAMKNDPVVLVVAPLSGHHATLLRDTVRTLLRDHKVYVTDWRDARMVPLQAGDFGLDDYITTVRRFIAEIGAKDLSVIAVCQPTVPVLAAVSLMASAGETTPRNLVLMGGPVDPRNNPTQVNSLATTKPLSWFSSQLIHIVPSNYPGHGRRVYPGFLQHMGFIAMNPSRHFQSHWDFYGHLVRGDLEDADGHRRFYDEYNAVLDMPETYYLDTIEVVFQRHLLPRGEWDVGGERVRPQDITGTSILTIEGELDDISGLGQTRAALGLCSGVDEKRKRHFEVKGAGHYGIFSGRRWREKVYPEVKAFIRGAK
jgi:poly(3-hydroxybutyrate) depolymerase